MNRESIFVDEAKVVIEKYPTLEYVLRSGTPILFGIIELKSPAGDVIDIYEIEIHYRDGYPYRFPMVFEVGGKIPKNVDWHIFENIGNCCIKVFPEEILICKSGITLTKFIEEQVVPYFYNQTFRRENGYFLKERAHGIQGWLEFFADTLKTRNIVNMVHALELVLKRPEFHRTSYCFCGSGKKYRKCHKEAYETLSYFSNNDLAYYIDELKNTREYQLSSLKLIQQL
jgi:hypothetical protein